MLWLGQAGAQARLCVDWGIAMPGSGGAAPTSTSISRTTNSEVSLSWSRRLARRFMHPIFLSLDLPFLASDATGVSPELSGKWLLLLEKLVVQKLQQALADRSKSEEALKTESHQRESQALQGEMVGR
ncbi:MAG: hypothetical protein CYPHOPRED_001000 [Cyphobasidiales sp. Tagirdzhanova-0007]|nr:MAG: hypothetical protein CYPHOPRED_001000 [Cyphobasidiales sp. Tagirdzhanova-0007]